MNTLFFVVVLSLYNESITKIKFDFASAHNSLLKFGCEQLLSPSDNVALGSPVLNNDLTCNCCNVFQPPQRIDKHSKLASCCRNLY